MNPQEADIFEAFFPGREGKTLHFDIMTEAGRHILEDAILFGKKYLEEKGFYAEEFGTRWCDFVHREQVSGIVMDLIREKGYFILKFADIPARLDASAGRRDLINFIRARKENLRFSFLDELRTEELQEVVENINNATGG